MIPFSTPLQCSGGNTSDVANCGGGGGGDGGYHCDGGGGYRCDGGLGGVF